MMMKHKTFLSWWSFGLIHLHIVACIRTIEGEEKIRKATPGSDHPIRKFPKSKKMHFIGEVTYQSKLREKRWGSNFENIKELCTSQPGIPSHFRLGYGETMANFVFYHSVPDNTPGMLWLHSPKWKPLFPNRTVPGWLFNLINSSSKNFFISQKKEIPTQIIEILRLLGKGIRKESSLARLVGFDLSVLRLLISKAKTSGFLTESNRLTDAGRQVIEREEDHVTTNYFDRSLYIPQTWCVDKVTVQPF